MGASQISGAELIDLGVKIVGVSDSGSRKLEIRLEIAKLCSEFNGDPLDKTSNLLAYLAKNEFYTEMIKNNYK